MVRISSPSLPSAFWLRLKIGIRPNEFLAKVPARLLVNGSRLKTKMKKKTVGMTNRAGMSRMASMKKMAGTMKKSEPKMIGEKSTKAMVIGSDELVNIRTRPEIFVNEFKIKSYLNQPFPFCPALS